jgi:hypothetical protein
MNLYLKPKYTTHFENVSVVTLSIFIKGGACVVTSWFTCIIVSLVYLYIHIIDYFQLVV